MNASHAFDKFSTWASEASGSVPAFAIAVALVTAWLAEGLVVSAVTGSFGYFTDDKYQLQINTLTTVLTFLLVVLVQYTTNKGDRAIQLKLDVLIDASTASNRYASVEGLDAKELCALRDKVAALVAQHEDDGR